MRWAILLLLAMPASGAWTNCRQLTPTTQPGSSLTDFTALVSDTYAWMAATGSGGDLQDAQGDDFRFYSSSDCATGALKYRRLSWNSSTGAFSAWVKIPTFASGTSIWIGTGDSGVTTDGSDAANTWPSSVKVVYQMDDNAANTTVTDDLGATNLTNQANTSGKTTSGQIGSALVFNDTGTPDYATAAGTAINSLTTNFMIEGWLYRTGSSASGDFWLAKGRGGASGWAPFTQSGTHQFVKFGVAAFDSAVSSSTNTWEHIVWTVDGSNVARLYKNGSLVFTSGNNSAIGASTNEFNLAVARDGTGAVDNSTLWKGRLDYIVVRNALPAVPADWIAAEYANQSNPSGYWSVGSAGTTKRRIIFTQ